MAIRGSLKILLILHAVSIDEVYALEELFKGLSNKLHKVRTATAVIKLKQNHGPAVASLRTVKLSRHLLRSSFAFP